MKNIREQMAESLEKMKELEAQVKSIPILQVQLFVLKEEKRKLLQQLEHEKRKISNNKFCKHCSHSYLENLSCNDVSDTSTTLTRDIGTCSSVMTRDVSISCQQTQTRDIGIATCESDIEPRKLGDYKLRVEYAKPTFALSNLKFSKSTQSDITLDNVLPLIQQNSLYKEINVLHKARDLEDCGINTEVQTIIPMNHSNIFCKDVFCEKDLIPEKTETTNLDDVPTVLLTKNLSVRDYIKVNVKDFVCADKNILNQSMISKKLQSKQKLRNKKVQTLEMHALRTNVSVTAKPKTHDIGTNVLIRGSTKSIAVGPDPSTINTISLNSMNLQNLPFNYNDLHQKRMLTKSSNVTVTDLIKTTTKFTDTSDLSPKTREFGTLTLKKKCIDVSVGESLKFNDISNGVSYCYNCKNASSNLVKQTKYNNPNVKSNQIIIPYVSMYSPTSYNEPDNKIQFIKEDTHAKLTDDVIKCKTDNKDQYNNILRSEHLNPAGDKTELSVVKTVCGLSNKKTDSKVALLDSLELQYQNAKPKQKLKISKEIEAALKVLNDNLKKLSNENISCKIKSADNIVKKKWFEISSTETAIAFDLKSYLDLFQEYSIPLLEHIINMTDSSGNTAVHYAVSHGNFDVVSVLLDSKVCNTNKPNTAGYTAFMLAALADVRNCTQVSVAKRLFQNSDVNIRAKLHGQTALMLAVSHGRKNMTKLLLEAGAEINIQDEDGSTALMCAAEHGHIDIVRLLLNKPVCDSSILDLDGSSALKIALEAGYHNIGVLLYAHEHVNRGSSPYILFKRRRRSSK